MPLFQNKRFIYISKITSRVLIVLIPALVLSLSALYLIYRKTIHEEAGKYLEKRLSEMAGRPVSIGSIGYVPPHSLSFSDIKVSSRGEDGTELAFVKNVTVKPDILRLVMTKRLFATISFEGLRAKKTVYNASGTIRTASRRAAAYKDIADPALVEHVSMIEGKASIKGVGKMGDDHGEHFYGMIALDNKVPVNGELRLEYNGILYFISFNKVPFPELGYETALRSDHIDIRSSVIKNEDSLLLEYLSGTAYGLALDIRGELSDYLSPQKISLSVSGIVDAELKDLGSLPEKAHSIAALPGKFKRYAGPAKELGRFIKSHGISGLVSSVIVLNAKGEKFYEFDLTSKISSDRFIFKNIRAEEVEGMIYVDPETVDFSFIRGKICGGDFLAEGNVGLRDPALPYDFTFSLENTDIGMMFRHLTGKKNDIYGLLDMDLYMNGNVLFPQNTRGDGRINITRADLGPMPILTPLLGNIYSSLENIFTRRNRPHITSATADLRIKDRRIMTDNLTLWGNEIYISSRGYVDLDGNLDFVFENEFRDGYGEEPLSWQKEIRTFIVTFGKVISRARLTGTIKNPQWKFDTAGQIKDLIGRNIGDFLKGISE